MASMQPTNERRLMPAEFLIADTFSASLGRLTGAEQKAANLP
jgi:hypothetical protein